MSGSFRRGIIPNLLWGRLNLSCNRPDHWVVLKLSCNRLQALSKARRFHAGQLTGASLYISLFVSAFLAATILPAQSEAVLAYQISAVPDEIAMLIALATLGNVLGAVVNWGLGIFSTRYRDRAWFPVGRDKLERAEARYRKFGRYSLLLSWVPFIGDPITVVAGMLREPLWSFLVLVTIAKSSRYIFITMLMMGVT